MGQKELTDSNKIILALDGSRISKNTSVTTIQIAKMLRLEIIGLYVIDEELVTIDYADYSKELGVDDPSLTRADRAALFEKRGHDVLQWLNSSCEEHGVCMMTEMGMGGIWDIILNRTPGTRMSLSPVEIAGNYDDDNSNHQHKERNAQNDFKSLFFFLIFSFIYIRVCGMQRRHNFHDES